MIKPEAAICRRPGDTPPSWFAIPRKRFLPFLVFILAALPYLGTLTYDFVFDDKFQIAGNRWIRDFSSMGEVFSSNMWGFGTGTSNYYRPFLHVLWAIVFKFSGTGPWGYHLANILLNCGSSVLVFLISFNLFTNERINKVSFPQAKRVGNPSEKKERFRTSRNDKYDRTYEPHGESVFGEDSALFAGLVSAFVFMLHPVHTEAVAWASGLPDMSFSFFFLLAFHFWIRDRKKLSMTWSFIFFSLSMFSKETAVMLPPVLLAYDYLTGRERPLFHYAPFFLIIGIYLILRVNALGGLTVPPFLGKGQVQLEGSDYIINIFPIFALYIGKLILPLNLNALILFHVKKALSFPVILSVPVFAAYLGAMYIAFRKKKALLLFILLFFLLPMLPALYLRGITATMGERYLYLPSLAWSLLLAYGASLLLEKKRAAAPVLAFLAILLSLYAVGTLRRNLVWRDDLALWSDTVKKSPEAAIAYSSLGKALFEENRLDEAEAAYKKSLMLLPDTPDALNDLGALYGRKGQLAEAVLCLKRAIMLQPGNFAAHNNLGIVYMLEGRVPEAIREFRESIRIWPYFGDAYFNLGNAYLDLGRPEDAARELEEAVRLVPERPDPHYNLAIAYRDMGLTAKAQGEMEIYRALAGEK